MASLEFETRVSDSAIELPDEIASRVPAGTPVRVSITPVDDSQMKQKPDDAWKSILDFIENRKSKGALSASYTWRREDAYEHLT